jgi:protein translocase SecG subunit
VLLQPGKTDAGALFTSNVSSAAFGPRGTASVLSKLTITAAVIFMLSALLISMPVFSGNVSVLSGSGEVPVEETSVDQQSANTNTTITTDNSNGALIQTPATNSFQADVNAAGASEAATDANAAAANANTAPANK